MRTDRYQPPRRHRPLSRPTPQGDAPFSAARLAAEAAFGPPPTSSTPTTSASTPDIRIVRARTLQDLQDCPERALPAAEVGTATGLQPVATKAPRIFLMPSPAEPAPPADAAQAVSATPGGSPRRRLRRRSSDLARQPGPVVQHVQHVQPPVPQVVSELAQLALLQETLARLEPVFEDIRFARQWLQDVESSL